MNILFVLYGDFTSNSANPLVLYARELHSSGHCCAVAVPSNIETISQHLNPSFRPLLYRDVLAKPESAFPDGRPADVIHACTPREVVRCFITSYMAKQPTPLLIYLEDNESWISTRILGLDETTLARHTEKEISDRLPDALAHPFYYGSFIGLADAVAVIQDKLKAEVPPWVYCKTVMLGVDLEFFSPRPPDLSLLTKYGITENEKVIVYHGGLNGFTKPGIETLCRALGIINQRGYPCRLLRTGPFALDFLEELPDKIKVTISDLGLLPKQELPDLLALADVFVQPGKIDPFEDLRLPGKVPEFLAMGRPVVMPGANISHLFRDGLDAVILHTGSADEIASKCIGLFSDPQKADRIGCSGRILAEKYFDLKTQVSHLENVYRTACHHFNPLIASKIWQERPVNMSVTDLLVRKLKLLAELQVIRPGFGRGDILGEHASQIELMQRRVKGLEMSVVERDQTVVERDQAIQKIFASRSWYVTRPLRAVKSFLISTNHPLLVALRRSGRLPIRKIVSVLKREGLSGLRRRVFSSGRHNDANRNNYTKWIRLYDTLTDESRATMQTRIDAYTHKPLISILMPTYNSKSEWLIEAIESVRKQVYLNWELCIADDASSDTTTRSILERYQKEDSRIKVIFRKKNGHISAASNSALGLTNGEWVALLDHDDLLSEHALFWVADAINNDPDVHLIYSDEDKIDESGRRFSPYFKCDWNLDLFYSHNLITHLGVYRSSLVSEIFGFRQGFEGAQDYDLALRCIERIDPKKICHIPRILYHWREHHQSTAKSNDAKPYAMLAGETALNEHFHRKKMNARAELVGHGYRVRYLLPDALPLVSLIILTKNGLHLIRQCIESILKKTNYPNYEILIVDNGSDDPEALSYFKSLEADSRISIIRDDSPFNFSALNNAAVKLTRGELIGLLNNDIKVISPDWLSEMVSHALRPDIGVVGARLWYPNDTLQHGGIIVGIGGWAGHSHKGFLRGPGYAGRTSLVSNFTAVTGACMVIQKSIYLQIGGLNEVELEIACNDVDFCLRVREAGYRNIWTPYAELYHYESATRGFEDTPKKQARFRKEVEYMKQRWGDLLLKDPAYSPNLTLDYEDFSLAWPPRVELLSSNLNVK